MAADRRADEEAIDRVLSGDRDAFAVLVDRHGPRVHGALLRMLGDPEAADDLAQEALVKAYTALGTFRKGSAFYTWLYAIALNLARSEFRRRKSLKGRPAASLDAAAAGDPDDGRSNGPAEPTARGPGPVEAASGREDAERVHRALAALDEEFREAVVLRDLEGLSYEEIAEATGVPAGTVRSRIHRGRALLRERLVPEADRAGGAR